MDNTVLRSLNDKLIEFWNLGGGLYEVGLDPIYGFYMPWEESYAAALDEVIASLDRAIERARIESEEEEFRQSCYPPSIR